MPRHWLIWPTIRGFPASNWSIVRDSDAIGAALEQNSQDALAADVFGSPSHVLDGEVILGTGSIELLRGRVEVRPRALIVRQA